MIYKFRIVSDEVDDFRREILIDEEDSFLAFHNIICQSVDFDPHQMSSFFICDSDWEKQQEITLEDMDTDMSHDVYLMKDTRLSDLIEEEGQKLLFTFDYLTDRCLFIQLREIEPGSLSAPECILSRGEAPSQTMDIDEFDALNDSKAASASSDFDMDEDFYGSSEFNEDEMGDIGFDEMPSID